MKPVRLPAAATLALPRWALFALGLLYILPGLIGREPWKNDDAASFGIMWTMAQGGLHDWLWPNIAGLSMPEEGPLAFWLGAASIKLFGWLLGDVLGARMATIGIFMIGVLSVWFTAFNLGRRSDAQPLRLAFGGQPEPNDFGRTLADAAVLIYIGCLGLLSHSHENTAETLQVSLLAYFLYRAVRYVELPSLRNAALMGLSMGVLTLTRGWIAPAALTIALFLCTLFLRLPAWRTLRHLALAIGLAALIAMIWLLPGELVRPFNRSPLQAWMAWNCNQLSLPSLKSLQFFYRVGMWFCWPAWPFAAWAVYAWRRQHHVLHIVVPLTFVAMLTLLALFHPNPDQSQMLPLLPPLAVMAAFGLLTMKRGAINAIDWFSVMVLTIGAGILWLLWFAKLTGWPVKLANNVLKLVPGMTPELDLVSFFVAAGVTAGWIALVHWRISRQPAVLWRAVVLSSGGLILIWVLLMTLFLPELNYSKSYAIVASQIANKLPPGDNCINTNVGPAQRASFVYYGHLPFSGVRHQHCKLLLLQDSTDMRDGKELLPGHQGKEWIKLWEGRRPSDDVERFQLFQRAE
ncbi:ArnT family glycosyltransferase [Janthinobacterium agaricidamnosum]|uniref:Putative membrane protein n=1 Tax=Janthinobacterium agaricidamnosum NBRC 102515 = DSM 9628 TaxID=1349767 RepID=W0V048_9BURK|nr:glycosyltransferase family 39 protein [Janthinobacterium agaricidamnosum]CDG81251.1 putative membrane protein [Janthinobacterium agaricidamnosum NBRC 102515 = DSM 9628]